MQVNSLLNTMVKIKLSVTALGLNVGIIYRLRLILVVTIP